MDKRTINIVLLKKGKAKLSPQTTVDQGGDISKKKTKKQEKITKKGKKPLIKLKKLNFTKK